MRQSRDGQDLPLVDDAATSGRRGSSSSATTSADGQASTSSTSNSRFSLPKKKTKSLAFLLLAGSVVACFCLYGFSVSVCDDSCPTARDGTCDDGRFLFPPRTSTSSTASEDDETTPSPTREIKCDLGTDCSDCGGEPWEALLPESLASPLRRPIAELRAANDGSAPSPSSRAFATKTATDPPFVAVHADPSLDVDVSAQLASLGTFERGLTQLWRARLKGACGGGRGRGERRREKEGNVSPPLVLDVGANFGYYSLYAASLGCRVVAWEPVPKFSLYLEAALLLNSRLSSSVEVRRAAACDRDSSSSSDPSSSDPAGVSITVPASGVWGTASVEGANIDRSRSPAGDGRGGVGGETDDDDGDVVVEAKCERVDTVVERLWRATKTPRRERIVALMKVDVEGYEPAVLSGASRLLERLPPPPSSDGKNSRRRSFFSPSPSKFGSVSDVVLEYSPGVPERAKQWDRIREWPEMLRSLRSNGFVLAHVPFDGGESGVGAGEDLLGGDWASPLPVFEEVTDENLAADVADARELASRTLGCPLPKEVFDFAAGESADGETASPSSLSHPLAFSRCNAIPEQLHPHSFRATFGHNTNVWASRGRWVREGGGGSGRGGSPPPSGLLRLGDAVGVFKPGDPLTSWFPERRSGVGMGGRRCESLPAEVRVAHRCRCVSKDDGRDENERAKNSSFDSSICGAEEVLVTSLAAKGLMPPLSGKSEASVALLGG